MSLATLCVLTSQIRSLGAGYERAPFSGDDVVYYQRGNAQYELLRKGFNSRINKYPKVIAVCRNTAGVQQALQYGISNKLPVTVKSGGHCMEGFSSNDGGLVINLSLLNGLEWTGSNSISVGPARTLKNIYDAILPKGKYLPGGSCQSVGIGGLTLGGGYGLLSRAYGLTCDSLTEATMVSGNGEIINTKNDADLLWALKGGGNGNFGVVTEMKFNLAKAPATMRSTKFRNQNVSVATAVSLCRKWFELSAALPNTCFSAFIFNGRSTYILLTNVGADDAAVLNFTAAFTSGATQVTKGKVLPLAQALRSYYGKSSPLTFKNASAGLYKNYGEIESVMEKIFSVIKSRPGMMYQVNTLGGVIGDASLRSKSAFAHRDCLYFSELQAYWESPALTPSILQKFQEVQELFAAAGVKAQYRNYPDVNFRAWDSAYYGQNLERLTAIKRKYDPANTFAGPQTLKA